MMIPGITVPTGSAYSDAALEGLVRINQIVMDQREKIGKPVPPIYKSGVRYAMEDGPQRWRHCAQVIREGRGADCKNLAAWRAAELRRSGQDGRARVHTYRTGPQMLHAVVMRGNGAIEDPSVKLGMRKDQLGMEYMGWKVGAGRPEYVGGNGNQGVPSVLRPLFASADEQIGAYDDLTGEEYIGVDATNHADITVSWERTSDGWTGTVRVPLDAGRALFVKRDHADKDKATRGALNAAAKVLDSKYAQALIPPEAKFALNIVRSSKARSIAKHLLSLF
jgi:hypothetical protein